MIRGELYRATASEGFDMAEDIPNLRKLQKEPHLEQVPPVDGSEDFVYDSEDHGTIIHLLISDRTAARAGLDCYQYGLCL